MRLYFADLRNVYNDGFCPDTCFSCLHSRSSYMPSTGLILPGSYHQWTLALQTHPAVELLWRAAELSSFLSRGSFSANVFPTRFPEVILSMQGFGRWLPHFFSSKVVPFSCPLIFCWRLWGNVSIKPPCCLGAPGLGDCLVCSTHAVTHFYGVCLWLLCKERKTGGLGGKASSLLYKQTKRIVVLGFGEHLN